MLLILKKEKLNIFGNLEKRKNIKFRKEKKSINKGYLKKMEKQDVFNKTLQFLQGIENQKKEDQNYLRKIKDYQNTILKLDEKDVDLNMLYSLITFLFIKTKFENIKEPGWWTSALLRMKKGEK
jgi:hypothetical protein